MRMRDQQRTGRWAVAFMLGAVGACGGQSSTDPVIDDEVTTHPVSNGFFFRHRKRVSLKIGARSI